MQLVTKNVQVLDRIVRFRTNPLGFFEDRINQDAYVECVEREFDLIRFRKKIGMSGEYEQYMDNYIASLYSYIEGKLTTGHRTISIKSIYTTYPDNILDAVRLYLGIYMKNESNIKCMEECKRIKELIEIGKEADFSKCPPDFSYVDLTITEKEKPKIFSTVLEIVNDFEQSFINSQ